jgi:peptidyl-prolyl cis-trans isomerase SurA
MKKIFSLVIGVCFFINLLGNNVYEAKPVAKVDNMVITSKDVNSRIALILFITQQEYTSTNREKVKMQAIKGLIDETLCIKEAQDKLKKHGKVSSKEIDGYIENVAKQNNMTGKEFLDLLVTQAANCEEPLDLVESFKQQIKSQIAWARIAENFAMPVSDKEVSKVKKDIEQNNHTTLYDLSEIVIPYQGEKDKEEARKIAQDLLEKIKNGSSFYMLAQQFSKSAYAAQGGHIGRLGFSQMDKDMQKAVSHMKQKNVYLLSKPGAFQILLLNNISQPSQKDQESVSVKIASITVDKDCNDLERVALQANIERLKNAKNLKEFLELCHSFQVPVQSLNDITLEQAEPEDFKVLLKSAKKDDILPEIPADGGVQLIYIVEKGIKKNLPLTAEEIKQGLENKKRNEMTQMYFNKLKGRTLIQIY